MAKGSDLREPAVAGKFYPLSARELEKQIGAMADKDAAKSDAIAAILPHAGYIYSGRVAALTVSRLKIKESIILLGPNHTGLGADFSIASKQSWKTPLGEIRIDSKLAGEILSRSRYIREDELAHREEHSLEVELPLLQYFKKDFRIVPITMLSEEIGVLKNIGLEIARAVKAGGAEKSTLIIASSDMTHYEPQAQAEEKDKQAIEAILGLDEDRLAEVVIRRNISMCGVAPVITMLSAARALGAKSAELVKYQTSGEVTGDKGSVVGYAGLIIS